MLLITLVTTHTVLAQSALPGEDLYRWKVTSEHIWRGMSADPLVTDLRLVDRRLDGYIALSRDETVPELDHYFSDGTVETGTEFQIATPEAPVIRP